MAWTLIYRKGDGTTEVSRHEEDGDRPPRRGRGTPVLKSLSRGVGVRDLAAARKLDQQLGVCDNYEVRGPIAYKVFKSRADEQKWNRAHHRVDHNGGYGDSVPGDFAG
jgi:hypothetical protein